MPPSAALLHTLAVLRKWRIDNGRRREYGGSRAGAIVLGGVGHRLVVYFEQAFLKVIRLGDRLEMLDEEVVVELQCEKKEASQNLGLEVAEGRSGGSMDGWMDGWMDG
jgi:hypothetical protein